MIENKDDLISRESLSKSIRKSINEKYISWTKTITVADIATLIFDEIDNAPTVEPCYQITSCLNCKNYDKENHNCPRFCEVIRSAIEERPQGEWLPNYTSQFFNPGRSCSLCGKIVEFSENYCPQCGADMRGEQNV